jgi:anti-sigma B factor antagonist
MTPAPKSFLIEVKESACGARVLTLSGALTLQTLFEFQDVVSADLGKPLILDFAAVPYMDSAGLGFVLKAYGSWQRLQRGFAITGINGKIKTLLTVTGVDSILPCFESMAAAEAGMAGSPKAGSAGAGSETTPG